ncbi:hypothetical protein BDY19DRAFT_91966 [Irpex rosettiformis]|uniref:Uncharacterized protein n=1 Tax=Irpex rosettiformis TaxID=378272 RepID=A0ACB8U6T9_9APHY|nr:hypothetical protein BDY19DRAFT_91966 [Irpex rosettiformis]
MAPASPLLPLALDLMGNVNLTIGASVIFTVLNGTIFGITSMQTFLYYNSSQEDGKLLRWTVLGLWILDLFETILFTHSVYNYSTTALMNPLLFATFVWSAGAHVIAGAVSNLLISIIFTYRAASFSKSRWPWFCIGPLAILAFVASFVLGTVQFVWPSILTLEQRFKWLGYVTCSVQAASDVTIMLSVCYVLLKNSRQTRNRNTTSVINKLIFFSVNTCVLTCSTAIAVVITEVLLPRSNIWEGLISLLPKFMLNSLLALLNSREHMRNQMVSKRPISIQLTEDSGTSSGTTSSDRTLSGRNVRVNFGTQQLYSSRKVPDDQVPGRQSYCSSKGITDIENRLSKCTPYPAQRC